MILPSPVGHLLCGILIYLIFNRYNNKYSLNVLSLYIFFSVLPDIDFALGFIVRDPNLFHQGLTHTLGAAAIAGTIGSLILRRKGQFINCCLLFTGLYYFHVVLDYIASASDTSYPFGVALLWPFSIEHYSFPVMIFLDIWRGETNTTFIPGLFNFHNFLAILIELMIFLPPILLFYYFSFHKDQADHSTIL